MGRFSTEFFFSLFGTDTLLQGEASKPGQFSTILQNSVSDFFFGCVFARVCVWDGILGGMQKNSHIKAGVYKPLECEIKRGKKRKN